ncbi:MAG: DUF975 family protein [Saccharofermentans sp.]|nr:DUF975 family protein [Saccharofermentans sp.]
MWSRKEVKAKGKAGFKRSYWKAVLVALIIGIIGGSAGFGGGYVGGLNSKSKDLETVRVDLDDLDIDFDGLKGFDLDRINDLGDIKDRVSGSDSEIVINGVTIDSKDFKDIDDLDDLNDFIKDHGGKAIDVDKINREAGRAASFVGLAIMVIVFIIAMVISVISFIMDIFLFKPIEFGCKRFFRKNLDEPAKLSNIVFAFSSHYKNIIKTAFFYNLFIFLWSLLFVIPGIIKSYSYRLVPYIMGENPDMNWRQALDESARLMRGNKWRAFVYDLSFLGWGILSALTLGILGAFYVNPYKNSSDAALYEAIRYGGQAPVEAAAA